MNKTGCIPIKSISDAIKQLQQSLEPLNQRLSV